MPFSKPPLRLQIRLRLAWPRGCFDNCACFEYTLRASDGSAEPEAEPKTEAVDSKRATWKSVLRKILPQSGKFRSSPAPCFNQRDWPLGPSEVGN